MHPLGGPGDLQRTGRDPCHADWPGDTFDLYSLDIAATHGLTRSHLGKPASEGREGSEAVLAGEEVGSVSRSSWSQQEVRRESSWASGDL